MKSKNKSPMSSVARARKRVDEIKGFYLHLMVYLFVNVVLLFSRENLSFFLEGNSAFTDSDFWNWMNWETYLTPLAWGIGLASHGISVFGKNPFLGKAWEAKQIAKYMNKDT